MADYLKDHPYGSTIDKLEELAAGLRTLKVVTGLSREEKRILDESADYLENLGAILVLKGNLQKE